MNRYLNYVLVIIQRMLCKIEDYKVSCSRQSCNQKMDCRNIKDIDNI